MNPIDQFNTSSLTNPKQIAVCDQNSCLTYDQLYKQSNQLANHLIAIGIKKGMRVGILTQRQIQLPMAILGVLKAGAAYVPLDPEYPLERIAYMIDTSKIDILIVDEASEKIIPQLTTLIKGVNHLLFLGEWIPIDLAMVHRSNLYSKSERESYPENDPQIEVLSTDTIVILFTSGSTGKPKGVELTYGGYINNFANMQELLQLKPGDKMAQTASQCFDISVTELWMPLLFGASVYISSNEMKKNPWALADWVNKHQIDMIQFVPSLFQNFLLALDDEGISFRSIKKLLFIGESLRSHLINKWFKHYSHPECLVYNLYGPVETSIEVSAFVMNANTVLELDVVPIGKPFKGVEFLLKEDQILHLSGVQLAKGYLNPKQTAQSFHQGEYNTGDIVEKLPSGDYLFLRRKDRQIKIRGYRVELDEIELALVSCPEVQDAAVIVKQDEKGDKIVAYVMGDKQNLESITFYLSNKLPSYMMPHFYQFLPQLPLNQNGKVNYNALKSGLTTS